MKYTATATTLAAALLLAPGTAPADTLVLPDGTVLRNCYVRDEGTHFVVWESAQKVGSTEYRIIPRSQVAEKGGNSRIERPGAWDAHPQLPDLSVTYIEMNPKLAGLHALVQYEGLTNASSWTCRRPTLTTLRSTRTPSASASRPWPGSASRADSSKRFRSSQTGNRRNL